MTKEKNKKSSPFCSILKFLAVIILSVFLAVFFLLGFSAIHRKNPLSMIPQGYSVFIHSDSVWKTINPLLDLQAVDLYLSGDDFKDFRPLYMSLRQSELRNSFFFKMLCSRKVNAGFYPVEGENHFVAAIDLSYISAATRLSPLFIKRLNIENFSQESQGQFNYYKYNNNGTFYYLKPFRNLLIATDSQDLLLKSFSANNHITYSKETKKFLSKKSRQQLRIIINSKKLVQSLSEKNPMINKLIPVLAENSLTEVGINLSDAEFKFSITLPNNNFDTTDASLEIQDLVSLIQKPSTYPLVTDTFANRTQYYTVMNVGTLQDIKNCIIPILCGSEENNVWTKADSLCQGIFNLTLDDLILSWTGDEFSILGLDEFTDPVLAVKVKDELKRQEVFEKVISSIIIKNDTSLILDGVRLPKLMLPGFFQKILGLFNITLPSPYYLVENDIIYFSQSAEALSTIHNCAENERTIEKNGNWQLVSKNKNQATSFSLFYDMNRNQPFFLNWSGDAAKILKLYSIGRADLRSNGKEVEFSIHAIARHSGNLRAVPGFPLETGKADNYEVISFHNSKNSFIAWTENDKVIKTLDLMSLKTNEYVSANSLKICDSEGDSEYLWALCENGIVLKMPLSLANEEIKKYSTGLIPATKPVKYRDGIIFVSTDNILCHVPDSGFIQNLKLPDNGKVKAAPSVNENLIAIYEKSFDGGVYLIKDLNIINNDGPYETDGIGMGSPSVMTRDDKIYSAFVTQSGELFIWCDGILLPDFPKSLDGIFTVNLTNDDVYFYGLSTSGHLYRISLDGSILSVIIPWSCESLGGIYSISSQTKDIKNIFVSVDGNFIYGFNDRLELLSGFPVAGCGKPAFADVNSDHYMDCFAMTLDNKLNAWNLR